MDILQHLAPYLLQALVLCPIGAGLLLACGMTRSLKTAQQIALIVQLLLAVCSLGLLPVAFAGPRFTVEVGWALPGSGHDPQFIDHVVWGVVPVTAVFLSLLPWLAMTAQAFTAESRQTTSRIATYLLLTGALALFIVGRDLGSLLSGAFFAILLIAFSIARNGIEDKRASASLFLSVQTLGLILLAAGLAMFMSTAAAIRSAPQGVPGESSATLTTLTEIIHTAIENHPAAEQLWGEYRTLPAFLVLAGIVVMGAGFPMQVWMSEVSATSSLPERLWLLTWVKAVFLIGLRLLVEIDAGALRDFAWWGLSISIPGALFVSSLLFSQAYLPRLQSSAVAWTQQILLIGAFAVTAELNQWLVPMLICQTAALTLFTIALTTISERFRSVEISSFQGLIHRASWLLPTLITCLLTLTLTPHALGLMQAWLATVTLQGSETWWGSTARLLYLLADILALAGLARVTRQLCTGNLRLPEMSPGLRERVEIVSPAVSLDLSRWQTVLVWGWAILALAPAFLFALWQLMAWNA
ncbi:hypothetical protein SH661x_000718 [Planctomicrobium sp. SH661]|uniref:hypothetical protein n=1 Tax=Planctomicrobium sp. SH661 TaxID=3448124 RepID=UPI003F5C5597